MHLAFTCMPGESYRKQFRSLCSRDARVFRALINYLIRTSSSSSVLLYVHRDSIRTIRDGVPNTSTSSLTQLLYSEASEKTRNTFM